jgi:hypothetical protein
MRQPRIAMTSEIALQDPAIACAIEKGTPCFQFPHPCWCFLRMDFCHSPVTQILPASHRIGKVNAPIVPIIHVPHRRGDPTFGHDSVRFT